MKLWVFALERLKKYCSHSAKGIGRAVFLVFGFVSAQSQGFSNLLFHRSLAKNQKSSLRIGYSIFFTALGAFIVTTFGQVPCARAGTPVEGKKPIPFQGDAGRDVSQDAWSSWQAPVETVDPSRLLDSTESTNTDAAPGLHFGSLGSNSYQLADAFTGRTRAQVVDTKPIERLETSTGRTSPVPAAPVLATTAPKNGSKRIMLIAGASVAILAYRKFRRTNARPYPPKPNFL